MFESLAPVLVLGRIFSAAWTAWNTPLRCGGIPNGYSMVGHSTFWTVLIDANTAEVIAFVPLDSFQVSHVDAA